MKYDYVYVFDKKTWERSLLGEVQNDFNMSLVLDGTKDSMKIIVQGYEETKIEPYTIVQHLKTNTWWIVSSDKVERYMNEDGFFYIHNLEVLGAIELLNARDLTDCGFNSKTYTVEEFLTRLIKLSNFEFNPFFDNNPLLNRKVEFIKTFENYTLLSAMREFLDGFNYSIKLRFYTITSGTKTYLSQTCYLTLVSKSGDDSLTSHDISYFNDVRETKTMNKESFGASVVSNAENVISSIAKTYPSTGGVKCSAHEYLIKAENAVIRLPSKVYKGNWLALCTTQAFVELHFSDDDYDLTKKELLINPLDDNSFDNAFDKIETKIGEYLAHINKSSMRDEIIANLNSQKERIISEIKRASTIKLYDGINLEPVNNSTMNITKGKDMPYLVKVDYYSHADDNEPFVFCDKETKQCLSKKWTGIAWERGSNEITGFDGFEPDTGRTATIVIRNLEYTDLQENVSLPDYLGNNGSSYDFYKYDEITSDLTHIIIQIRTPTNSGYTIHFRDNAQWVVNYIPMSDLKVKVDNRTDALDTHLYNQNGKLTDNYALSKLVNSYAKEISSDTITRFKTLYNFNDVPKVGSFVSYNSEQYVINNISLSFVQNEDTNYGTDFGYQIECEFTMSKYCATKSLMVNPNTNIRDYGIPQNYNVKRKQVYRDFYELNYSYNEDNETNYYLQPQYSLYFGNRPNENINYVCLIKLHYDHSIEGSTYYYYQLETTIYNMNKMIYVMLDFNDNNIIGYGSMNVYSGFVISRVLSGQTDVLNTPISYVDEKGKFQDIEILWLDNLQLTEVYDRYEQDIASEPNYDTFKEAGGTLYNYSVFIPSSIYTIAWTNNKYKIKLTEDDYEKDALEVPVFEYACQIDDTTEVLIGDNILKQYQGNYIYFYSYVRGQNFTQDNVDEENNIYEDSGDLYLDNSASIEFSSNALHIQLWDYSTYTNDRFAYYDDNPIYSGYDYAIFRHAYNLDTQEEIVDLILIAKNVPDANVIEVDGIDTIDIKINHYKLR